MPPKISVVVPTYCRPELLARCLAALQEQLLAKPDFEVIVVSDGPDDTTAMIVNQAKASAGAFNIHYAALPQKGGPAAARNAGWQRAVGALVAFTDDDTVPDKAWLQDFMYQYQGEELIAYTGKVIVPRPARPTDYERNTAGLETADFVTANCCCTRGALLAVAGFDEAFCMAWREDSDLEFRLSAAGIPIIKLSNAVVVHPVRKAPWGISIREQKKGMFNALLYKKFPELYRRKIQPSPAWDYYIMVAGVLLASGAFIAGLYRLALGGLTIWALLLLRFIVRRLKGARQTPGHICEMIATSLIIPFASVYWQLYGAWRYRVLFL